MKRNRFKSGITGVVCALGVVIAGALTYLQEKDAEPENIELYGPYDVVRVVDGDTLIVKIDSDKVRVRLIGVDTPESVADGVHKQNTPEGDVASEYTKSLLEGGRVYLEYDVEHFDQYDRTLAYVYLSDKETMVNELLISEGYARTVRIEPDVKYYERLSGLEKEACNNNKGFWGTGFFK